MNAPLAARWLHGDDETERSASRHDETVHARLARMKVERVKRQVDELRDHWPNDVNVLERLLLKARFSDERRDRTDE